MHVMAGTGRDYLAYFMHVKAGTGRDYRSLLLMKTVHDYMTQK